MTFPYRIGDKLTVVLDGVKYERRITNITQTVLPPKPSGSSTAWTIEVDFDEPLPGETGESIQLLAWEPAEGDSAIAGAEHQRAAWRAAWYQGRYPDAEGILSEYLNATTKLPGIGDPHREPGIVGAGWPLPEYAGIDGFDADQLKADLDELGADGRYPREPADFDLSAAYKDAEHQPYTLDSIYTPIRPRPWDRMPPRRIASQTDFPLSELITWLQTAQARWEAGGEVTYRLSGTALAIFQNSEYRAAIHLDERPTLSGWADDDA